jgi:hypothetical protein
VRKKPPDMTTSTLAIEEAAFRALTSAGMIADRDLLRLVDLSAIKIIDGVAIIPTGFIEVARKKIPVMFESSAPETDARKMTDSEFKAALKRVTEEDFSRSIRRSLESDHRSMAKHFGSKSK